MDRATESSSHLRYLFFFQSLSFLIYDFDLITMLLTRENRKKVGEWKFVFWPVFNPFLFTRLKLILSKKILNEASSLRVVAVWENFLDDDCNFYAFFTSPWKIIIISLYLYLFTSHLHGVGRLFILLCVYINVFFSNHTCYMLFPCFPGPSQEISEKKHILRNDEWEWKERARERGSKIKIILCLCMI